MGQVNVTINGRQFRMACEDGQEEHLQVLASELDQRIDSLRKKFGEIGDTRLTVMAAITVADELAEVKRDMRKLEQEISDLRDARALAGDRARTAQTAVAAAFNSAAERIEGITRKLKETVGEGVGIG